MKRFWNASNPRRGVIAMNAISLLRSFTTLTALCLVIAIGATIAAPVHAASNREASVERLIDRSGMKESIEIFSKSARQQIAAQSATLESEYDRYMQEIFQAVFSAERIRSHVVKALVRDYDPVHVAELDRWFDSELSQNIRDEEVRAQTAEATPDLLEFVKASESQPPNPERLELAKKINASRGASKLSHRLVVEVLRGMITGTAVLSQVDGHVPTSVEIEAMVESQTGDLDALLEQQMVVSLLFVGRNFSLSDNRKYLEHIESDAGKWFYSRSGEGLVSAMVLAGRAFGNYTAAWVQDQSGAESPDNTEDRRAKAAAAGREFAASNAAMACVDKVYEQRRACEDVVCFAQTRAFGEACLAAATPDAGLCADVPGTDDLARTVYWRLSRCDARGTPDVYCDGAIGTLQVHCEGMSASK